MRVRERGWDARGRCWDQLRKLPGIIQPEPDEQQVRVRGGLRVDGEGWGWAQVKLDKQDKDEFKKIKIKWMLGFLDIFKAYYEPTGHRV